MNEESIIYYCVLSTMEECRELEERYMLSFTSAILSAKEPEDGLDIIRNAKKFNNNKDQLLLLYACMRFPNFSLYIRSVCVPDRGRCEIMHWIIGPFQGYEEPHESDCLRT